MKTIKINFQDHLRCKVTDYNIMGKPTPDVVLEIPVIIQIDDNKVAELLLNVRGYKDSGLNEKEQIHCLLKNYKKLFLDKIISIDSLDLFIAFRLFIIKDEMNNSSVSDIEKIEVEIKENLYFSLQKMIEEYLLLKKEIDTNIALLSNAVFHSYSIRSTHTYAKIQKAIDFLYACAKCTGDRNTSFTKGNISDLGMYFNELSKRKRESNTNYQIYLRKAQSIIMHIHPPKTWKKKPNYSSYIDN